MSTRLKLFLSAAALLIFCAGAAITIATTSASAEHRIGLGYGDWAPSLGALAHVQTSTPIQAPPALAADIKRSASLTGGDPAVALASLRLLQRDLGATHADLYVYAPSGGAVCVVLWQRQTTCPTALSSATPGIEFILSPGGPGYPGQTPNTPPAIAGVANDSVESLAYTVDDGSPMQLQIHNNAFFGEIAKPGGAGFSLDLVVHYTDGSTKHAVLTQLGPFHINADGTRD
jgi:hypothetical protein